MNSLDKALAENYTSFQPDNWFNILFVLANLY